MAPKRPFLIPKSLIHKAGKNLEASDRQWALEQAIAYGHKEVLLPNIDLRSPLFTNLNLEILKHNLRPLHFISLNEFCLLEDLMDLLKQGVGWVVIIDQPLNAVFLEMLEGIKSFSEQIRYVFLPRKDWNFINTLKSLPYAIKNQLYIDFPMSLYPEDPFYNPEDVENILREIQKNFVNFKVKSFFPHFQVSNELLNQSVESVSVIVQGKKHVDISLVTTNVNLVEKIKSFSDQIEKTSFEIILIREKGKKTKVIEDCNFPIQKVWFQSLGAEQNFNETCALMNNIGAGIAQGEQILFYDNENFEEINDLLVNGNQLSRDLNLFKKDLFMSLGGFDPLYGLFKLSLFEFQYRYQKTLQKNKNLDFTEETLSELSLMDRKFGSQLFYHQYLDFNVYQNISAKKSKLILEKQKTKKPIVSAKTRYRFIRIKDAYLSLYKATPKVAIEGNLKFIWSLIWPPLERVYYKYVFTALFPIRKVYYFSRYQYEKRFLGLHGKENILISGEKNR